MISLRENVPNSDSIVRDENLRLSWPDFLSRVGSVREGIHVLEGANSIASASVLLAAAFGGCSALPLNPRLTRQERSEILALVDSNELRTGIYIATSGSCGRPKLVHLSPEKLQAHARAVNEHLSVTVDDHWLACLPFFHVGGMAIIIRCALAGAGITMIPNADAEIVANYLLDTTTIVSLVPTVLRRIVNVHGHGFPDSLRAIILGGGPIPYDLVERIPQVLPTYGLTEAGSMVTCARPGCPESERTTAGRALPGSAIKIADDNFQEVVAGRTGRILVQSLGAATEYVNNEKETALTFREGWIVTEDAGYVDTAGCLVVLGRRDRLIVSGGENIALDEVETAIRNLPTVRDVICVGVEEPEWGQTVAAVVESEVPLSIDALREMLRPVLAAYKLPRKLTIANEIPLLANGKPDYHAAIDLFR